MPISLRALFWTGIVLLAGCASPEGARDPRDPLEPMNRAVHRFNEAVDRAAIKPLAEGYRAVTPVPVQSSVRNFFGHLGDVKVFANNVLQFKLEEASSDFLRLVFNTTFGVVGLFDVATEMGLAKNNEDFGQTLGHWGVPPGPYLVLPLLGPSSLRDGVGAVVDSRYADPVTQLEHAPSRHAAIALRVLSLRADLLAAMAAIEAAALDPYEFTRDLYLERRAALVHDGKVPDDTQP